eukprot:g6235.t1
MKLFGILFFLPLACALKLRGLAETGEEACEGKNYSQNECESIGCCSYDSNGCHSSVGNNTCNKTVDASSITLPTLGKGPYKPEWINGAGKFETCEKMTSIFGVYICVTKPAWAASKVKVDHIAHVLAKLLDNNSDGVADDVELVKTMAARRMSLFVAATMDENISGRIIGQESGLWEAIPNSCDVPNNRGANSSDPSTWESAIENTPGNTNCDKTRDATVEEALHLLTEGAAIVWPAIWGKNKNSLSGKAVYKMNGNCGFGYTSDYIHPAEGNCTGYYAYDDKTCTEDCVQVEGVYWGMITLMGGLYTKERVDSIKQEYLLATPYNGMKVLPENLPKAKTFEDGAPDLFALLTAQKNQDGYKWIPTIMPDGHYVVTANSAKASVGVNMPDAGVGASISASSHFEVRTKMLSAFVLAIMYLTS